MDYEKLYKEALEKQGEPKILGVGVENARGVLKECIDKIAPKSAMEAIKPKFKVGDWIVYHRNDSSTEIMSVYDIRDNRYYFNDNIHFSWSVKECDEKCHLWSIKDAKPSDVLFKDLMDGMTFIFDGVNPEMAILYSFIINNDGGKVAHYNIGKPNTGIGYVEENKNIIHPATKEQRDLLFSKMEEEGYEWDSEKKEPKKIEHKPADIIPKDFEGYVEQLLSLSDGEGHGSPAKVREVSLELLKLAKIGQKPAWSEEDEKFFKTALWHISYSISNGKSTDIHCDTTEWFKSLKQRIKGEQ